ncbi:conserved hypothetical protein [Leishmania major strain Friedlin]|uniref:Las1-like protein n=1 Tax=Leishmania major TaxID=5664 RepID=Q4QF01_LEIMA|nr:conserved hypothetical protein [Leishmania major strain Friedlin]CAG9572053.1 Las1-like_-_putative [Leishmania major strain Friedlin]CAJ03438.1 conserved hypothetical protein [Leishmania major strain Friedlin]|eukprot:XP_001682097.1 conserved hypothetical protein [Leishmania major strain Friedlin]
MRRSHVGEAQRRQALAERRFRGHRIRRGLEELGDLDAPKKRKERSDGVAALTETGDASPAERATTATALDDCTTDSATAAARTTPAIFSTVFGADWGEWAEVKRVVFDMNATAAEKRSALETIHVWRHRARKERELPAYVESTEVLLDAMLQDEEDALKDGPLRMCYGAAISRVVHVMTGSFASGAADTYRKRASEIGFPEEAVEVRQRVAHGALPLTSELRWVCGLVLQFLFTQYWLEQERQVYLMQQEQGTSLSEASALRKPRQRQPARASTATLAVETSVSAASLPPPSVTIDDMKALLHDLESDADGDGESTEGGGVADKGNEAAPVTLSPAGPAPTAEGAARRDTSSGASTATIAGWRLS